MPITEKQFYDEGTKRFRLSEYLLFLFKNYPSAFNLNEIADELNKKRETVKASFGAFAAQKKVEKRYLGSAAYFKLHRDFFKKIKESENLEKSSLDSH